MALTTPYREQFLVADGITVTFPFDDHGDGFDAISKNYVKCEVYNADGSVIVPDFTVDLSAKTITITSLTTPDGQVLNAPQNGAIVRIYRDVPETQNTTAQALQASTAQQIVQNFDNIVAMIQELQYANEHFTLRSTLPQRDLKIDLLRDIDDQKLVYWDNEKRKLVVTNYRQDELLLPSDKEDILEQANAYSDEQNSVLESRIDGKLTAVESQIDANADAIQKTREDFASADQNIRADMNAKDSEIETVLRDYTERLNTLRTDHDDLGDDVSDIQAEIATKQDQLIAGDNIIISNNVISATGAGGGAGLDMVVVDQLPATGRKGIIYLVKKDGAAPDIHDEYVWIESTQSFELIGTTQVDLSGYAKKTYVDSADQQLKANQDSLYANQVVLSDMLNIKDADGNWTTLTTAAQAAIPAINELNEKIESAGDTSLPDQTGNAGKFLMTNGSEVSWGEALTNTAKSNLSLCIAGNDTTFGQPFSVWIGLNSGPENASASNSLAIGYSAKAGSSGIVLGAFSAAKNNGISIGYYTNSTYNAIQLGKGTNNDENTFKVGNANGNFEMMSADGTIPADRMSATAGTTGQVLTKTDTGMAWQEAQAGGTKITIIRYDE